MNGLDHGRIGDVHDSIHEILEGPLFHGSSDVSLRILPGSKINLAVGLENSLFGIWDLNADGLMKIAHESIVEVKQTCDESLSFVDTKIERT